MEHPEFNKKIDRYAQSLGITRLEAIDRLIAAMTILRDFVSVNGSSDNRDDAFISYLSDAVSRFLP